MYSCLKCYMFCPHSKGAPQVHHQSKQTESPPHLLFVFAAVHQKLSHVVPPSSAKQPGFPSHSDSRGPPTLHISQAWASGESGALVANLPHVVGGRGGLQGRAAFFPAWWQFFRTHTFLVEPRGTRGSCYIPVASAQPFNHGCWGDVPTLS